MENNGEERNRKRADRADKEIYQETSNVVRYGEAFSKEFWTREGDTSRMRAKFNTVYLISSRYRGSACEGTVW